MIFCYLRSGMSCLCIMCPLGRKLGAAGRDSLQAVKHEIAILKKVNHRNIVKLMEVIRLLVCEYVGHCSNNVSL